MNTKISDTAAPDEVWVEVCNGTPMDVHKMPKNNDGFPRGWDVVRYVRNDRELARLAADAVPVAVAAGISQFGVLECNLLPGGLEQLQASGGEAKLYLHPQPAALNEVGEIPALPKGRFVTDRHSGTSFTSYTAEQMQDYARAALAATGGQQVGEVQGDGLSTQAMLDAGLAALLAYRKSGGDYTAHPAHAVEAAINAALAARQPVATMSSEASQVARGMVAHCIEHRLCMGMDEGFSSFDPDIEHSFLQELREWIDSQRDAGAGVE